jgi:alpha-beta hydrolase superfamily lysophospholipase
LLFVVFSVLVEKGMSQVASALSLLLALLLVVFISACASPKVQPFRPAVTEPALSEHFVRVADGTELALRRWWPKRGNTPKAIVLALHGFNDYSYSQRAVGEALAAEGIAVIAYDQRGYGHSPEFGIWAGRENLVRDAADVATAIRVAYPDLPFYVVGESMGGAVAWLAAKEGVLPQETRGLILIAPAVWGGETMGWLYRLPLWLATHTTPDLQVTGKNLGIYPSDNKKMLAEMSRNPRVIKRSRMDTLWGIVHLMDEAYQNAEPPLPFPTLLLYGAHDAIIPKRPSFRVMERLREARIAYYPKGYHMLPRDLQGEVVTGDIATWIMNPTTPLPSGCDREVGSRLAESRK